MSDDLITRAEALNPHNHYAWRGEKASMFPELVAALKVAQAENELMYGRGYQAGVRQERENQEARR